MQLELDGYFLPGAYRFQMQFGKTAFASFFGHSSGRDQVLRERRWWLNDAEERYLRILPPAEPLLDETMQMALQHQTIAQPFGKSSTPASLARQLGETWEPDYLLLTRDSQGIRLAGACVVFPSSWSLEEKMGQTIEEIHEVVPTLNPALGRQIQTFLEKLKEGTVWTRSNWGLSHSAELNQHPHRRLPRLHAAVHLDEVFFRVEEQALLALPRTHGILFGIRIRMLPLSQFASNSVEKLRLALQTMPADIAEYKGIAPARERLLHLLARAG